ncbi:endoglucanase [Opitutaceae bacterium TAV1]|nr:endoglucanase [Opitutaceae bacterium TAV1]
MTTSPRHSPSIPAPVPVFVAVAVALLFALAIPATAHAADPVITNGDFSKPDAAGDWPAGWGKPKSGASSWETDPDTGKRFVRMASTTPGEMVMMYSRHKIPPGTKALELSFDWRVTGLKKGDAPWFDARLIYEFLDAGFNKVQGKPGPSYRGSDTQGWETRTTRFLVPENAAVLVIMPALFNVKSGTMDITGIEARPTGTAELDAAAAQRAAEAKARYVPPEEPKPANWPKELRVEGTKIVDADGREIWLQGLSTSGLETIPQDMQPLKSVVVGIEEWKANVIRMPVNESHWFGRNAFQKGDSKEFREKIDQLVTLAANRGAYLIIDLHRFRAPRAEHAEFWTDVATRYKNHPAVIFELFNEPHGISWEIWRNGGFIGEKQKPGDEDAFLDKDELKKTNQGFESVGMQALVKAVRDTGARNLILAGGLAWSYDLTGITDGYALDDLGGNGIVYGWHVYNWHKGWEKNMMAAAKKYPILVGEFGADIKKMNFIPLEAQEDPYTWVPDMFGFLQKHRLHYTAWCFHPRATPVLISDWLYTPTPFYGVFAKRALAGEKFELKKTR